MKTNLLSAVLLLAFFAVVSCKKDDNNGNNDNNNNNNNNNNSGFTCGSTFTDTRDNKQYTTVKIGNQCWFKKNLNIGTRINSGTNQANNSTIEKYCYNDQESNCDTYGGLYQWDEMMQYVTTEGAQGICPVGWHIPTDAEWTTLLANYTSAAGTALKPGGSSGFNALMGGRRDPDGGTYQINEGAYLWASTLNGVNPWYRFIETAGTNVDRYSISKLYGFSVRCLKNN